jgi:hypothetical protein
MMHTTLYISTAVALLCFILYVLDRRSRSEPIDWTSAFKLSTFGSLIAGGIAFVLSPSTSMTDLKIIPEIMPTQDIFVGTPSF